LVFAISKQWNIGLIGANIEMKTLICPDDRPIVDVERIKSLPVIRGAYVQGFGEWCVFQNIADFEIDGYSLIPDSCIKRMRLNASDEFYAKLWASIGIVGKIKTLAPKNTQDILRYLAESKSGRMVIIECEIKGEWVFSIGWIKKLEKGTVFLKHFDSMGKFEKSNRKIRIADISRIGYDERYIRVYEKYFRDKKAAGKRLKAPRP
jgi:hypothetical protein